MDLNRIYVTTDYEQFNWTEINREVNQGHVKALETIIDEGGMIQMPILVNPNRVNGLFEVPDGQHRLVALRNKKQPIRYIFASFQMGLDDITRINNTQRPWKTMDYVKAYAKGGNEHYEKLLSFFDEVSERVSKSKTIGAVSIRSVSYIAQGNGSNPNISRNNNIKNGAWEFRVPLSEARKTLNMLMEFEQFGCSLNETFIQALLSLINNQDNFSVRRLIKQAKAYPYKFVNASRGQDWMRMIEELYNFNKSYKNREYFRYRK